MCVCVCVSWCVCVCVCVCVRERERERESWCVCVCVCVCLRVFVWEWGGVWGIKDVFYLECTYVFACLCVGYSPTVVNRLTGNTGFDCMLETTPGGEEGEELDVCEEKKTTLSKGKVEDPYDLLVSAWESKVFPIIHQRFRNDQERKEGTEQIRGALRLGELSL